MRPSFASHRLQKGCRAGLAMAERGPSGTSGIHTATNTCPDPSLSNTQLAEGLICLTSRTVWVRAGHKGQLKSPSEPSLAEFQTWDHVVRHHAHPVTCVNENNSSLEDNIPGVQPTFLQIAQPSRFLASLRRAVLSEAISCSRMGHQRRIAHLGDLQGSPHWTPSMVAGQARDGGRDF